MAGQRQHSIDFVINAMLNGGFSGVFSKAQNEFVRLGAEIKRLQSIQKDISSYQRQEKAVQNTEAKLKNYEDQLALVEKQIEETTGSTTALEREKLKLEQRIASTQAGFERQNKTLEATEQRLKDADVSTGNLVRTDENLTKQIRELQREQDKAAESAVSFGSAGTAAVESVGAALAAAGIVTAMRKLTGGFVSCVSAANDFQEAMSAVEAISDASAEDMERLNAKAKELGATTKFTAQQSADAMVYMGMAGWGAEEMLNGMTGVTNLAAASGEDLAQVSDIVTDNLTAFGLTAADTAHFADVLAAAASKSNTNVALMGDTFKRAAPVAGALGYSIEDVAIMTGLMANAGTKGSRAATTLVNIFDGLLKGVTLTSEAFGEYEFSAIRADGTMKGFRATVDELREAFSQMSGAERVMNARELAGMRGYSGLLAILNATDADYAKLEADIDGCAGAAERMAKIRLDNLNGDLTIMKSAWEALKITIGEEFNPELRKGTAILTDLINGVNQFAKDNPSVVKGLTVTTGAVGALTAGVVGLSAAIKIVKSLELGTVLGGAVPEILAVGAGVAALAGLFVMLKDDWNQSVASAVELNNAVGELNRTLEATSVQSIENDVRANAAAAEAYLSKIDELGAVQSRTEEQELRYQGALAGLLEVAPELSDFISQTADEYGRVTYAVEGTTDAIWDNIEAMEQQAVMKGFQDYISGLAKNQAEVMVKIQTAEIDRQGFVDQYNELMQERDEILRKHSGFTQEEIAAGAGLTLNDDLRHVEEKMADASRQIDKYDGEIEDAKAALAESENEMLNANQAMKNLAEKMGNAAGSAGGLRGGMDAVSEGVADAAGPLDMLTEQIAKLEKAYNDAYDAALQSVRGQYKLWDEAEKTVPSSLDSIEKALDSQISNWDTRLENLNILSAAVGDIPGLYTLMGELVGDNSQESANMIAGLANAVKTGDIDKVKKLTGTFTDLREEQEKYAEFQADFQTNIAETTAKLLSEVDEAVAGMDRSHDAESAAHATIQAYIDEANNPDNHSAIRAAYAKASDEAMRGLSAALRDPFYGAPTGSVTQEMLILSGVEHYTPHAEGGILTTPHLGLVAEDGPEAVIPLSASRRDRGAELWTEAGRQMGLLTTGGEDSGRGPSSVPVQIIIQVQGNVSQDTVDAMQDYAEQFANLVTDRVMDRMEEQRTDAARRAF